MRRKTLAVEAFVARLDQVVRALGQQPGTVVLMQDDQAKAVLQDLASWEAQQETLALLKVLALGREQVQ